MFFTHWSWSGGRQYASTAGFRCASSSGGCKSKQIVSIKMLAGVATFLEREPRTGDIALIGINLFRWRVIRAPAVVALDDRISICSFACILTIAVGLELRVAC